MCLSGLLTSSLDHFSADSLTIPFPLETLLCLWYWTFSQVLSLGLFSEDPYEASGSKFCSLPVYPNLRLSVAELRHNTYKMLYKQPEIFCFSSLLFYNANTPKKRNTFFWNFLFTFLGDLSPVWCCSVTLPSQKVIFPLSLCS